MGSSAISTIIRTNSWVFKRKDLHALYSLVHGLHVQLEREVAKHFRHAGAGSFPRLFPLRRVVEETYYMYTRLAAALQHLQRWRL